MFASCSNSNEVMDRVFIPCSHVWSMYGVCVEHVDSRLTVENVCNCPHFGSQSHCTCNLTCLLYIESVCLAATGEKIEPTGSESEK